MSNPSTGNWADTEPWADSESWVDIPSKGSWKGNRNNPAPNAVQESNERSEKLKTDKSSFNHVDSGNRAEEVRRDKDTQKNFTITLYDIDEAIMTHLERLQLQVVDAGNQIKVPIFFGAPEKWTSARRDGYLRDKQGKLILPAMIIKRISSESDTNLQFFNRYLDSPVMKVYSEKNKYTQFSLLAGRNAPVNEVYHVVVPSHMVLTYHFIIWTEYVEQMNKLVETIQFNTRDYWGSQKGFRFRTRVETFSHTTELQADEDRIVKTEFDLSTHGYILPDSMLINIERHKMTMQKALTPKKVVMGMEVVATSFNLEELDKNKEKWRKWDYPNLQKDVYIKSPPISVNTSIVDNSKYGIQVDNSPLFLRIVPVPTTQASNGQEGDMSYDSQYFYIHIHGGWKRVAISEFVAICEDDVPLTGTEGSTTYNKDFFYIYSNKMWRKVAISEINLNTFGQDGNVMYDSKYFYIYTSGSWRRVAISSII